MKNAEENVEVSSRLSRHLHKEAENNQVSLIRRHREGDVSKK